MEILIRRFLKGKNETISSLYINNEFECYVLEDLPRKFKIFSKTRISAGRYKIFLRYFGDHYSNYSKRFKEDHPMLEIMNVINFVAILFHIGNSHIDTAGCLLTGEKYYKIGKNYYLRNSEKAYLKFYNKVAPILYKGEEVFLTIEDER